MTLRKAWSRRLKSRRSCQTLICTCSASRSFKTSARRSRLKKMISWSIQPNWRRRRIMRRENSSRKCHSPLLLLCHEWAISSNTRMRWMRCCYRTLLDLYQLQATIKVNRINLNSLNSNTVVTSHVTTDISTLVWDHWMMNSVRRPRNSKVKSSAKSKQEAMATVLIECTRI